MNRHLLHLENQIGMNDPVVSVNRDALIELLEIMDEIVAAATEFRNLDFGPYCIDEAFPEECTALDTALGRLD